MSANLDLPAMDANTSAAEEARIGKPLIKLDEVELQRREPNSLAHSPLRNPKGRTNVAMRSSFA